MSTPEQVLRNTPQFFGGKKEHFHCFEYQTSILCPVMGLTSSTLFPSHVSHSPSHSVVLGPHPTTPHATDSHGLHPLAGTAGVYQEVSGHFPQRVFFFFSLLTFTKTHSALLLTVFHSVYLKGSESHPV